MTPLVGVDAGLFPPNDHGGLAVYREELLRALAAFGEDVSLVAFGRAVPDVGASVSRVEPGPLARLPGLYRQAWLPATARARGVDLLHLPLGSAPLGGVVPTVVTVHDLLCVTARHLPYGAPLRGLGFRLRRAYHRVALPPGILRARRVVASSAATADDLERLLGVERARIRVVPLAAAPPFHAAPSRQAGAAFLHRHGLEPGYVLGFASIDPRKNAHRLVTAHAALPAALRRRHPLVLVLTQPHHGPALGRLAARLGSAGDVRRLPRLAAHEMPEVYRHARLLAFPSLHEGFGLPVLEAMTVGCPVLAAPVGGIPEVAAEAARWIDPVDAVSITAGLEELLSDGERRRALASAGARRARRFSWEATARGTLAAYLEALG